MAEDFSMHRIPNEEQDEYGKYFPVLSSPFRPCLTNMSIIMSRSGLPLEVVIMLSTLLTEWMEPDSDICPGEGEQEIDHDDDPMPAFVGSEFLRSRPLVGEANPERDDMPELIAYEPHSDLHPLIRAIISRFRSGTTVPLSFSDEDELMMAMPSLGLTITTEDMLSARAVDQYEDLLYTLGGIHSTVPSLARPQNHHVNQLLGTYGLSCGEPDRAAEDETDEEDYEGLAEIVLQSLETGPLPDPFEDSSDDGEH